MVGQSEPKYPDIEVDLSEAAGNTISVMSQMRIALRAAKVPASEVSAFFDEAMSQGYGRLLETCARWVRVKAMPADQDEPLEAHELAA